MWKRYHRWGIKVSGNHESDDSVGCPPHLINQRHGNGHSKVKWRRHNTIRCDILWYGMVYV